MNPLKININYKAQDGYLYGGRLFLVCNTGEIKFIPLWKLISKNLDTSGDEFNLFRLAFDRNNWLGNNQADTVFGLNGVWLQFKKEWKKYSKIEYNFIIDENDLTVLTKIESLPVFDFTIYGMRMFLGNRNGLFETGFSLNGDEEVKLNNKLKRVFDARTTGITAKSGALMVSSNSDGLFHGKFREKEKRIKVYDKPIKEKSIRTGWTGYDVLNYENQKSFDYLKNKYEKDDERKYFYSSGDEDSKKINIKEIGEETYSMNELFEKVNLNLSDVIYSFNSSQSCFLFLNDGRLFNTYWNKYYENNKIRLRSKLHSIPTYIKESEVERPISSRIVPNGCVIEYFDKVVLYQNKKAISLSDEGVTSIRTYPSSIRYRNLISIFDGEKVSVHSIFPLNLNW